MGQATSWHYLYVRWQPARPLPAAVLDIKLADLYQLQWHKQRPDTVWQRYASYTVTVSFQGKSRGPYKALFLFGHGPDGKEVIEPEDSTTSPSGLVSAMHEHLFPDAFVLTRLRSYPVGSNWLQANQRYGPACSVGKNDVCCDLVQLKCGPGRVDVEEGLSKSLPDGSALKP